MLRQRRAEHHLCCGNADIHRAINADRAKFPQQVKYAQMLRELAIGAIWRLIDPSRSRSIVGLADLQAVAELV